MYPKSFAKRNQQLQTLRKEQAPGIWQWVQKIKKSLAEDQIDAKVSIRWYRPSDFLDQSRRYTRIECAVQSVKIVVNSIKECYAAFGTIHLNHEVIPRLVKDYIANPLYNGYCRLKTVVVYNTEHVTIEIADHECDELSRKGLIAYLQRDKDTSFYQGYIKNLESLLNDRENLDQRMGELLKQYGQGQIEVYVGKDRKRFCLPIEANVIDLAYYVGKDVGNFCSGATLRTSTIKQRIAINAPLKDGDWVEIINGRVAKIEKSRRAYMKTNYAKAILDQELSQLSSQQDEFFGKKIFHNLLQNRGKDPERVSKGLHFESILQQKGWTLEEFFTKIGTGRLKPHSFLVENRIIEKPKKLLYPFRSKSELFKDTSDFTIKDLNHELLVFSECCQVLPNDPCVMVRHGISDEYELHRKKCKHIEHLEVCLNVRWQLVEKQLQREEHYFNSF